MHAARHVDVRRLPGSSVPDKLQDLVGAVLPACFALFVRLHPTLNQHQRPTNTFYFGPTKALFNTVHCACTHRSTALSYRFYFSVAGAKKDETLTFSISNMNPQV